MLRAVTILAVAAAYFAAGHLSLAFQSSNTLLVWLPTGFALGAIVRFGSNAWFGIAIGALFVTQEMATDKGTAGLIFSANVLAPLLCKILYDWLQHCVPVKNALPMVKLGLAAVGGLLCMAAAGLVAQELLGSIPLQQSVTVWLIWWSQSLISCFIVAPVFLIRGWFNVTGGKLWHPEFLAWMIFLLTTLSLIFVVDKHAFVFLPMVAVSWAALRFRASTLAISGLLLGSVVVLTATRGHGPFIGHEVSDTHLFVSLYLVCAYVQSWFIQSVATYRQAMLSELIQNRQALLQANDGILVTDRQANIVFGNISFQRITGFSPEEYLGRNCKFLQGAGTDRGEVQRLSDAVKQGTPISLELLNYRRDGQPFWNKVSLAPIRDEAENITGFTASLRDVTERRAAEAAIRESERMFASVFNNAPVGMGLFAVDGRWITVNQALADMLGYTTTELMAKRRDQIIHPDDQAAARARVVALLQGKSEFYQIEKRLLHKEGSTVWVLMSVTVLESDNGAPTILITQVIDITARTNSEAALLRSTKLLDESQTIAKLGGWEFDVVQGKLYWTAETYRLHDTSPEEFDPTVDAGVSYFFPESRETITKALATALDQGIGYDLELETLTTKGRKIDVRTTCTVTLENGRVVRLTGIFQDISEQKAIQLAMERVLAQHSESEARFSAIVDTALVGILSIDESGRITLFNREAEAIFGYTATEMIGAPLDRLLPDGAVGKHQQDVASFRTGSVSRRDMGNWRHIRGKRADGVTIPLTVVISKVTVAGKMTLTAIVRDMSETEIAEAALNASLEERRVALVRAESANRAKTTFLATMSHELRTPLNAIIGFSDLIKSEIHGPLERDKYREYITDINESGRHLLSLINDVLDLSRIESGKYDLEIVPTFIGEVWEPVARMTVVAATEKNVTVFPPDADSPLSFMGDRRAVVQILTNLIGNAIKFTPSGGSVTITMERKEALLETAIVVRDTGIGIPHDMLADVVKPFDVSP